MTGGIAKDSTGESPGARVGFPAELRKNVACLIWMQAFGGAQVAIWILFGGHAGAALAHDPALATMPIFAIMFTSMIASYPLSALMAQRGRRTGFLFAFACGLCAGAVSALALVIGHFGLLLIGGMLGGVYLAGQTFFPFAAADLADEAQKPRVMSWVLIGGVVSAFIGPGFGARFADLLAPAPYAGAFLCVMALNLVAAPAVLFLSRRHKPAQNIREKRLPKPSLFTIYRAPPLLVGTLCAMAAFGAMNLVMTATPLAMQHHDLSLAQAAATVRWHVFAMFIPGFFTGSLIARFGHSRVILTGFALNAISIAVALSGAGPLHFPLALILLGVAWNFGLIGGTSLLAASYAPGDADRVQGANNLCVQATVALTALLSGVMLEWGGWRFVNIAALALVTCAAFSLWWLKIRKAKAVALNTARQ